MPPSWHRASPQFRGERAYDTVGSWPVDANWPFDVRERRKASFRQQAGCRMPPSWDRTPPRCRGERHTTPSVWGPSTRTGPSTLGNVERPPTDEGPVSDGKPDAVCRRAATARPRGSAVSGIRHRRFVALRRELARRRELALRRWGTSKGHEPTKGHFRRWPVDVGERRKATNRRQTAWPPAAAPVTSSAT